MKNFIYALSLICAYIMPNSNAQAVSMSVADNFAIHGYIAVSYGSDSTMNTATANNIAAAAAIKQYVKDSSKNYPYVPAPNYVSHALSGTVGYTISTTKQAMVSYTIQISCTASIGSTSAGSVTLSYSLDGGTTYTVCGSVANSNTVSLAIVLNSVNVNTSCLSAIIPKNALCKLVTTSTGTTTITSICQQETY